MNYSPDNNDRAKWGEEALKRFNELTRPKMGDDLCIEDLSDAIADLICDLGHFSEQAGVPYLSAAAHGLAMWSAERAARDDDPSMNDLVSVIVRDPSGKVLVDVFKDGSGVPSEVGVLLSDALPDDFDYVEALECFVMGKPFEKRGEGVPFFAVLPHDPHYAKKQAACASAPIPEDDDSDGEHAFNANGVCTQCWLKDKRG